VKRHVVAGASDFLGSHLVERRLRQGDRVTGVDDPSTGRLRPLRVHDRVDRAWNLASPASPPDYQRLSIETLRVGSEGRQNLLELAKEHGSRFFQASTSEVHGDPGVTPQPGSCWGEKATGRTCKLKHEPLPGDHPRQRRPDVTKARRLLGWEPRVQLEEGLRRTIAWFSREVQPA
jgi:UDP-glucuronate decarboxylase